MIFEENFKIGIEDVDSECKATNKAILSILEGIACTHSYSIGSGPLETRTSGSVWVLLDWRVQIIKRPIYQEEVLAKTWSRPPERIVAYRDFEILSKNGERLAIASSKWVLVDIATRRPTKLTEENMAAYKSEDIKIFDTDLPKIQEPKEYESTLEYKVQRRDIDMNEHMHNLNYLDLAYEILPEEVYRNSNFNNIIIEYKKEIMLGEEITCYYSNVDGKHVITIKNSERTNSIIILF